MLSFKDKMKRAVTNSIKTRVTKEMPFLKLKNKENREQKSKAFKDLSCYAKTMFIIDFPFDWIRRLTILPCQPSEYDKYYTIAWPYLGILATEMIVMKSWPTSYLFWVYLPVAIGWSVLFYCIQGTVNYEPEEEEVEDEKKSVPTGILGGALEEAKNLLKKENEIAADKDEKPERNKLPGSWYNLISILGMI